jgi:hypothetical protein
MKKLGDRSAPKPGPMHILSPNERLHRLRNGLDSCGDANEDGWTPSEIGHAERPPILAPIEEINQRGTTNLDGIEQLPPMGWLK